MNRITAYTNPLVASLQGASDTARTGGEILRRQAEERRRSEIHLEEIAQARRQREADIQAQEQDAAFQKFMGGLAQAEAGSEALSPRHQAMLQGFADIAPNLSPGALQYGLREVRGMIAEDMRREEESAFTRSLENASANGLDEQVVAGIQADLASGAIDVEEAQKKLQRAAVLQTEQMQTLQEREMFTQEADRVLQDNSRVLNPQEIRDMRTFLSVEGMLGKLDPAKMRARFYEMLSEKLQASGQQMAQPSGFQMGPAPPGFTGFQFKDAQGPSAPSPGSSEAQAPKPGTKYMPDSDRVRYWPPDKIQELQTKVEGVIYGDASREEKLASVEKLLEGKILPGSTMVMIAQLIKESDERGETLRRAQGRRADEERAGVAPESIRVREGRSQRGQGGRQPEN